MRKNALLFDPLIALGGRWIEIGEYRRGAGYYCDRPKGLGANYLVLATVAGSGLVTSGSVRLVTKPGTIALYEPYAPQHYRTNPAIGKWHLLWAHFHIRPTWSAWLDWPSPSPGFLTAAIPDHEARDHCWASLRHAMHCYKLAGVTTEDLALNAIESALLWIRESLAREGRFRLDPRIRRSLDLMGSDLTSAFSVKRIAKTCGLSPSRFAHLFRAQVGMTPQQFNERCRLNRAAELLRTGNMTIASVAEEVGFNNQFYFSNRFRKAYGKCPRAFVKTAN